MEISNKDKNDSMLLINFSDKYDLAITTYLAA